MYKIIIYRVFKFLFQFTFLFFIITSCIEKKEENKKLIKSEVLKINSIEKDSLISLFNDFYKYKKNYSHKNNLEKNYPQLLSRIKNLKINSNSKLFDDLDRLIQIHSVDKNTYNAEIISINNRIVNNIIAKDELKEIRSLLNSQISIDSTKTLQKNYKNLKQKYNRINSYFHRYEYFRDSLIKKLWSICPLYYKIYNKIDLLNEFDIDSLKQQLLKKEVTYIENKKFIKSIFDFEKDSITPTYLKNMAPVFKKSDNEFGVYNFNLDYYADKKLFNKSSIFKKLKESNYSIYEFIIDSKIIENKNSINIYAFNDSKRIPIKISGFGYQPDECIEPYYIFPIDLDDNNLETLLFTSKYKLVLDFISNENLDKLINNKFPDICKDCPDGWNKQKIFANLKGFANIYFASTAKKNIDDTETLIRALYYINDNKVLLLWFKEFDTFGCACL